MLDLILIAFQVIQVNETVPCFLNFTDTQNMWLNCGATDDYLSFVTLPWEWITGGNFSMVLASVFVLFSYIKYHKIVYPILVGTLFLPIAFFVFPEVFLSWAIIMAFGGGITVLIFYIMTRQTKEY